jgi:hypothetical protein
MTYKLTALFFLIWGSLLIHENVQAQTNPDDSELFYASFEKSSMADRAVGDEVPLQAKSIRILREGRRGSAVMLPVGAILSYSALGNLSANRGTMSFWWRSDLISLKVPFTVVRIGRTFQKGQDFLFMDLAWNGKAFQLRLRDSQGGIHSVESSYSWSSDPKVWVHLAFSWDEAEGIQLFVDGKPTAREGGPLSMDGTLDQFAFLSDEVTPSHLSSAGQAGYLDELRIYGKALNPEQVARVLEFGTAAPGLMLETGKFDAERWNASVRLKREWNRKPDFLDVRAPVLIRRVAPMDGRDSGKFTWAACDGRLETSWPQESSQSSRPHSLILKLPNEPFNYLQIEGDFIGRIRMKSSVQDVIWEKQISSDSSHRFVFPQPVTASELILDRAGGVLNEISLFLKRELTPQEVSSTPDSKGPYRFRLLPARQAVNLEGLSKNQVLTKFDLQTQLARNYSSLDREAWIGVPEEIYRPEKSTNDTLPFLHPIHLICPPFLKHTLLEKIRIKLNPSSGFLQAGTILHITLHDPLDPWRDLLNLDFRLGDEKANEIWLDPRSLVCPAGKPVWMTLTADPSDFAARCLNGAEIELLEARTDNAEMLSHSMEDYRMDRLQSMKTLEQGIDAPKFWTGDESARLRRQYKVADLILGALDILQELFPKDAQVLAYWTWTHPLQAPADFAQAARSDPTIPLWAQQQQTLNQQLQKILSWWQKHPSILESDAGGDVNSRAVLLSNLAAIGLMDSPSSTALYDRHLTPPVRDGVASERPTSVAQMNLNYLRGLPGDSQETNHEAPFLSPIQAYQSCFRPFAPAAISAYAQPEVIEGLMAQAKRAMSLTGINPAGHRHYKAYLFNWKEVVEEGTWGREEPSHQFLWLPTFLIGWYNGNPNLIQMISENADAWLAHWQSEKYPYLSRAIRYSSDASLSRGAPVPELLNLMWAAYRLTGKDKYLGPLEQVLKNGNLDLTYRISGNWGHSIVVESAKDLLPIGVRKSPIWDHNLYADESGIIARQIAFSLGGEKSYVEDLQAALIKHFYQNIPFYTELEPNLAQVQMPLEGFQKLVLGGVAIGPLSVFPSHAVSWENGGINLAKLVEKSTARSLKVVLFNLSPKLMDITMRVWDLENGTYDITEGTDVTQDDKIDVVTTRRQLALRRGSPIPLTLRPRKVTVLEIQQDQRGVLNSLLPDLAIGPNDFVYDWGNDSGELAVHNLGNVKTPPFFLAVENERHLVVFKQEVAPIEAAQDLIPKSIKVPMTGFRGLNAKAIYIRLDPFNKVEEISKDNNQVRIVF